jgi:hypothetical protein
MTENGRASFRILRPKEVTDVLRSGMHVRELTKKVGQMGRTGKVIRVNGDNVEVLWDDGHVSSLSGAVLQPIRKTAHSS